MSWVSPYDKCYSLNTLQHTATHCNTLQQQIGKSFVPWVSPYDKRYSLYYVMDGLVSADAMLAAAEGLFFVWEGSWALGGGRHSEGVFVCARVWRMCICVCVGVWSFRCMGCVCVCGCVSSM